MRLPVFKPALVLAFGIQLMLCPPKPSLADEGQLPRFLWDREGGVPSSMSGTYIRPRQLLVFPFYEHVSDHNQEYNPAKFGFGRNEDFRGRYGSSSAQMFIAYGVTERLAVELEISYTRATLEKSSSDTTPMPSKIEESGLGDVEGQIRLRLAQESGRRPEVFGFLEITAPSQKNKLLIGNSDWDFRPGVGVVRGFSWGTMTVRTTLEYSKEQSALNEPRQLDIGETSVEYLKRLSHAWRLNLGFEGGEGGAPDEWELRSGLQWRMTRVLLLKLDNSVGLSSKAPDWTPQIGLMFSIPR
ncbi:MAG: hypothetical protein E6K76_04715 [Candidatus Eisenbacteria bacterium]|uniref:Uncharacterized protein n=1 Tax=Eiseniibacteriota bacterium TaxID=2212470 RepID=A0A538T781_UNCEI|nr:MAG: hypothetical protein E6K76_04715 [Candidatus Eisenbacteria bacterium]